MWSFTNNLLTNCPKQVSLEKAKTDIDSQTEIPELFLECNIICLSVRGVLTQHTKWSESESETSQYRLQSAKIHSSPLMVTDFLGLIYQQMVY